MIGFPNAKVNIGLNIIEKRPDNFHNIETVLYPVGLKDILEIIEVRDTCSSVRFTNTGIPIDACAENNLCVKAYNLLSEDFNLPPVSIHLHKIIPVGAGLGGGSADAAFTIKMLNEKFRLDITDAETVKYAKQLGSDCAFFLENIPSMATGKGDRLEPVEPYLEGFYLVLVFPGIYISTSKAYSGVIPEKPERSLKDQIKQPVKQWKDSICNYFEKIIFSEYPEIREIKEKLYKLGAVYSSLSGSGSAVYGIFDREPDLKEISKDYTVWQTVI